MRPVTVSLVIVLIALASAATARQPKANPAHLRSVWICLLVKYHVWPDGSFQDNKAPFVVGIFKGDVALNQAMQLTATKAGTIKVHSGNQIVERAIRVVVVSKAEDIDACKLIFVAEPADDRELADALKRVKGKSVLTIGDSERFLQAGGCVRLNFDPDRSHKIQIHTDALKEQKIRFDPKLLTIADPYHPAAK